MNMTKKTNRVNKAKRFFLDHKPVGLTLSHLALAVLLFVLMLGIVFAPAPTQGTPLLNSTRGTNLTAENLTAYNISTTDGDGDPVYNVYNWFRNQTSYLVLNMPFENNTANVSATTKDYSTYQNNGTITDGAIFVRDGGYDGNGSYTFDGVNDHISIQNAPSLNPTAGVTLEVWAMTNHTTNVTFIAKREQYELHAGATASIPDTAPAFEIRNGDDGQTVFTDTIHINDSRYHHIVGVFTPNQNVLLYIDGVNRSTNYSNVGTVPLSSIDTTANHLFIGRSPRNNFMNGSIDSVRIWNASLSSAQILALYNNRTNVIVADETTIGETWNASVTPNDGFSDGITAFTTGLLVINGLPNMSAIILAPTTTYTDTNVTATVNFTDPDGHVGTVYFEWFVNNVSVYNQTNTSIADGTTIVSMLSGGNFSRGQIVNVSVYSNDTYNASLRVSSIVATVQNTAPVHGTPILNATNGLNRTTENLTVYNISTEDLDAQPVKNVINWYRNDTSLLVLHVPFEANTTNSFAKDYTPFQNNITTGVDSLTNHSIFNRTGGYDSFGSMVFNATNVDFFVVNATSLQLTRFSLESRVYIRSAVTNGTLMSNYRDTESATPVGDGYGIVYEDGRINFTVGNGSLGSQSIVSTTILVLDKWYHVVGAFNGTNMSLYIDNTLEASRAFSGTHATAKGNLYVGTRLGTTYLLNGSLDELRIWNASLSAEQVNTLYNNQTNVIVASLTETGDTWNASITPYDTFDDGVTRFTSTLSITSTCGDGNIEGVESCDGSNLNGATCISRGYPDGGTLSCTASCTYDISQCSSGGSGPPSDDTSGDGGGPDTGEGDAAVGSEEDTTGDGGGPDTGEGDAAVGSEEDTTGDGDTPGEDHAATEEETADKIIGALTDLEETIATAIFGKEDAFIVTSIIVNNRELYDELGQKAPVQFMANKTYDLNITMKNVGNSILHDLYVVLINAPYDAIVSSPTIVREFEGNAERTLILTIKFDTLSTAYDPDIFISTREQQKIITLKSLFSYSLIDRYFTKEKIIRQTRTYVKYSYRWTLLLLIVIILISVTQRTTFATETAIRVLIREDKLSSYPTLTVVEKIALRYNSLRVLNGLQLSDRENTKIQKLCKQYGISYEIAALIIKAKNKLLPRILVTEYIPDALKHNYRRVNFISPMVYYTQKRLINLIDNQRKQGLSDMKVYKKLVDEGWDRAIVKQYLSVVDPLDKLASYVKAQKAKHVPVKKIITALLEAGWNEEVVNEYVNPLHEVKEYITQKTEAGIPLSVIALALTKVGWKKEVIDDQITRIKIRTYIKQQITKGVTEKLIANKLLHAGWSKVMIFEVLDEEELQSYVKREYQRGFSHDLVELALVAKGWKQTFVKKYLKKA